MPDAPKAVALLSHYFAPLTLPPTHRVLGFARALQQAGLHPIVVTRHYDTAATDWHSLLLPTQNQNPTQTLETFEGLDAPLTVLRLPQHEGRWQAAYRTAHEKGDQKAMQRASRMYWLANGRALHHDFYALAKHHLTWLMDALEALQTRAVVATGPPFGTFDLAEDIRVTLGLAWLADYRDLWTAPGQNLNSPSGQPERRGLLAAIRHRREAKRERSLVSGADAIATVSGPLAESLQKHLGRAAKQPVWTLPNGIPDALLTEEMRAFFAPDPSPTLPLKLLLPGTLYPSQDPENQFLHGLSQVLGLVAKAHPGKPLNESVQLRVIGAGQYDGGAGWAARLARLSAGDREGVAAITTHLPRLPYKEYLAELAACHVAVHLGFEGQPGVFGSRLYDLLACRRNVLYTATPGEIEHMAMGEAANLLAANSAALLSYGVKGVQNALVSWLQGMGLPLGDEIGAEDVRPSIDEAALQSHSRTRLAAQMVEWARLEAMKIPFVDDGF